MAAASAGGAAEANDNAGAGAATAFFPVFDPAQWGALSKRAERQTWLDNHFKPASMFVGPKRYNCIENGVGYIVDHAENRVTAHRYDGKQVGSVELREYGDDEFWLDQVDVKPKYQRQGIGTKLIQLALTITDFFVPDVPESAAYMFSLTPAGSKLIDSCLAKGILDPSLLRSSVPLEDGASDPGLAFGEGPFGIDGFSTDSAKKYLDSDSDSQNLGDVGGDDDDQDDSNLSAAYGPIEPF